jgi:hypothetical protein
LVQLVRGARIEDFTRDFSETSGHTAESTTSAGSSAVPGFSSTSPYAIQSTAAANGNAVQDVASTGNHTAPGIAGSDFELSESISDFLHEPNAAPLFTAETVNARVATHQMSVPSSLKRKVASFFETDGFPILKADGNSNRCCVGNT